MFRSFLTSLSAVLLLCTTIGCGSGAPAEATGDPVPADYEQQQQAAQKAAQEEAMKNAKRRRR